LLAKNGRYEVRQYWDLDFPNTDCKQSKRDYQEQFIQLLDDTVRLHMISDVPIGFLLSGGLDSTAMLSFAARKTNKEISTFTVGFSSDGLVDERPFARLAAEQYGSKHYELSISPADFAEFLPSYVRHMEEPVCEPPAIALYYISKLASQHVKVLVSGEGGDEAFAGYENYRNLFWFENMKSILGPFQKPMARGMASLGRIFRSRVLTKYGLRMGVPFEEYYLSRTSSPFKFFPQERLNLYSAEMASRIDPGRSINVTEHYMSRAVDYNILNKMLYVDTKTWLPDDLLIKADRMTMANSVELRVPFLDHKVLEFAAGLPRSQKIRRWTMKYLAKQALRRRVPEAILQRPKAGFPVPYRSWLQTILHDWISEILLDRRTLSRGYFQERAVEKLLRLSVNGRDFSKELFSLVILEVWHRTFADTGSVTRTTATGLALIPSSDIKLNQPSGVA